MTISGKNALQVMRHEAGVHRVQRIPATEKSGRVHTSVVSVAVMPQPSEIEVVISEKDLKVDAMKASGPGGQAVNTTDSAVRLTHIPTGVVITCQSERSQVNWMRGRISQTDRLNWVKIQIPKLILFFNIWYFFKKCKRNLSKKMFADVIFH